jgi:hypothetical protein
MTMFELLQTDYRGEIGANDLINHVGQMVRMVGLYVCEKTVHTKNNQKMWFGNFLDVEGNAFDTVHFPEQYTVLSIPWCRVLFNPRQGSRGIWLCQSGSDQIRQAAHFT